MDANMRCRKIHPFTVPLVITIVGLSAAACVFFLLRDFSLFPRETIDMRGKWAAFYKQEVAHDFSIPGEASIVKAEKCKEWVDEWYELEFRLPHTRTPESWLKEIAPKRLEDFPKGKFVYDASGKEMDIYLLEYDPDEDVYRAIHGSG